MIACLAGDVLCCGADAKRTLPHPSNERKVALAKILFIVVLLLVVYLFFKSWRKDAGGEDRQRPPESKLPEDMVRCEICGVNLPRSEAFTSRSRLYCSDEHRKIGVSKDT